MKINNFFKIALIGIIFGMGSFLFSSCGSTSTNDKKITEDIGPYADTNADTSPGVTELNKDEIELKESDKQLATGTWIKTKDNKVIATLNAKYASGGINYSLFKGSNTTASLTGTTSNQNDTQYFVSNDEDCSLTLEFDKVKFTVGISKCENADTATFNGVYQRKK